MSVRWSRPKAKLTCTVGNSVGGTEVLASTMNPSTAPDSIQKVIGLGVCVTGFCLSLALSVFPCYLLVLYF